MDASGYSVDRKTATSNCHCERSEAISMIGAQRHWDCRVALLLAMTVGVNHEPGSACRLGIHQPGGAIRNAFDELKIHVSTKPVSCGFRPRALIAPTRHIQFRISCCPL